MFTQVVVYISGDKKFTPAINAFNNKNSFQSKAHRPLADRN